MLSEAVPPQLGFVYQLSTIAMLGGGPHLSLPTPPPHTHTHTHTHTPPLSFSRWGVRGVRGAVASRCVAALGGLSDVDPASFPAPRREAREAIAATQAAQRPYWPGVL